jgi:hypothetical protein
MSRQVVLLRVGVDAGCGGIQGPLFEDGSFEFVCIPDNHGVSAHTYGNMLGRDGKPLSGYFGDFRSAVMAEQHVHHDPEFETFTYRGSRNQNGSENGVFLRHDGVIWQHHISEKTPWLLFQPIIRSSASTKTRFWEFCPASTA